VATITVLGWTLYPTITSGVAPFPSVLDWMYLAVVSTFAIALTIVVRRRVGYSPWEGVLDSAIVTVGLGVVSWDLIIELYINQAGSMSGLVLFFSLPYPVLDLLLVMASGWCSPSGCTAGRCCCWPVPWRAAGQRHGLWRIPGVAGPAR